MLKYPQLRFTRSALPMAALATALALAGCSLASQANTQGSATAITRRSSSFSSSGKHKASESETDSADASNSTAGTATDSSAQANQQQAQEDVSNRLPYVGMSASLIDSTYLGAHEKQGDQVTGGQLRGSVPYTWYAQNGTGDMLFSAYVKDGRVIKVAKFNLSKNYWSNGSLPDRTASGEAKASSGSADSGAFTPSADPEDYDTPEAYADEAQGEFAAAGSADSWNDACAYWENR